MTSPAISVVITSFNRPHMLRRAIASVLAQTHSDFELIVVDDLSTTDMRTVVSEFNDDRIRLIRNAENKGLPASRNVGMNAAQSEFVAFLDDDDEFKADKLQRQLALARSTDNQSDVIYCAVDAVDEHGSLLGVGKPVIRGNIRQAFLSLGMSTLSSTNMFRRDSLMAIGGHDETLRGSVDHDLWMKLAAADYTADFVDDALAIAYQHSEERLTTNVAHRIQAVDQYLGKWREHLQEWMGESAAQTYVAEYKANVLGFLMVEMILDRRLRDSRLLAKSIFGDRSMLFRKTKIVLTHLVRSTIRRVLPKSIVIRLRSLRSGVRRLFGR